MAAVLMDEANLGETHLEGACLGWAKLNGIDFYKAYLTGAYLFEAYLEQSYFRRAHLEDADLRRAHLTGAHLEGALLSNPKRFGPRLGDVDWGEVNIAVVEWSQIKMLSDEYEASQRKTTHLYNFAIRANRQLALALQEQGSNEDAARFAYRAQKLQRVVLRRQKKFGQYIFSGFLDLLAGYGYRPGRSVIWYLVTIFGFALAYFAIGHLTFFPDSFVFSLTSFHGRGFFPGLGSENSLHNPLVIMAAFEAVVGLLIEISFIATFTQRFFGR